MIPLEELSPIAHPLAQKKLVKKLHKTIKKGLTRPLAERPFIHTPSFLASKRRQVKRGVKEIVKGIRKGEKGWVELCLRRWFSLTICQVTRACGRYQPDRYYLTLASSQ